jgi:hypothetical protein
MTSFQGKLVKKVLQPEQTIKKDTNFVLESLMSIQKSS